MCKCFAILRGGAHRQAQSSKDSRLTAQTSILLLLAIQEIVAHIRLLLRKYHVQKE